MDTDALIAESTRRLDALAGDLRDRGVEANPTVLAEGDVGVLPARSEALGADLILLGSHGHGPLHDLLVGGTIRKIMRLATCPVVVVKGKKGTREEGTR